MSRHYADISLTLYKHLNNFESGHYLQNRLLDYPGSEFTPPNGNGKESYIKANIIWNRPVKIGAFDDTSNYREMGILNLLVHYTNFYGELEATRITDRLCEHFNKADILTGNQINVRITMSYKKGSFERGPWLIVPVSVEFWAYSW